MGKSWGRFPTVFPTNWSRVPIFSHGPELRSDPFSHGFRLARSRCKRLLDQSLGSGKSHRRPSCSMLDRDPSRSARPPHTGGQHPDDPPGNSRRLGIKHHHCQRRAADLLRYLDRLPSGPERTHVVDEVQRIQGYLGGGSPAACTRSTWRQRPSSPQAAAVWCAQNCWVRNAPMTNEHLVRWSDWRHRTTALTSAQSSHACVSRQWERLCWKAQLGVLLRSHDWATLSGVLVSEHRVWTAGIQSWLDETHVACHAAWAVVVRFDQSHELADADRVREIVQHEPDSTRCQALTAVLRKDPPGHLGTSIRL